MTTLSKNEVVEMARECNLMGGLIPVQSNAFIPVQSQLERFAALCRAPLVAENAALKQAHEINADTLNAMQVEIDDWKARALKAEQVGEPFGWYSAKEDDFMLDKIRKTHERLNSHTHRIGKYDLALYTTPPQPAAQQRESCTWTEQDDKDMPGTYESSCGEMWSFTDGGVKENRVTYCHHCGGKVVLAASPQEQT